MQRDYTHYIQDMKEAISKILRYTEDVDYEAFCANELLMDGVIRNLEIIGEAAKKIPAEIRKEHPGIEWNKISGLRDVLAHSYFGIDTEIIWDVVRNKIPKLKMKLASFTA